MKALSIMQPWASMIVLGYKPVENRSWNTTHRGPTLIHAGKSFDAAGWTWIVENARRLDVPSKSLDITLANFPSGGIIGSANLYDVTEHPWQPGEWEQRVPLVPWFFGHYGFWMKDACKLPFRPARGGAPPA